MKTERGDLIEKALAHQFDVIIHGCNCFCTMEKGIAKSIKQTFPEAYEADLKTQKGDKTKLGTLSYAVVEIKGKKLIVVNAYTQFNWRGSGTKANYNAIASTFKCIKEKFSGLRIGYPGIGAGLAGGDWHIISQIINHELAGEDHTFVAFDKQ